MNDGAARLNVVLDGAHRSNDSSHPRQSCLAKRSKLVGDYYGGKQSPRMRGMRQSGHIVGSPIVHRKLEARADAVFFEIPSNLARRLMPTRSWACSAELPQACPVPKTAVPLAHGSWPWPTALRALSPGSPGEAWYTRRRFESLMRSSPACTDLKSCPWSESRPVRKGLSPSHDRIL